VINEKLLELLKHKN